MKLPYLILGLTHNSMMINVYKVMAEDNAKEINADAYLVKSIGLGNGIGRFISNKFFLGWVDRVPSIVNLFEKALLLDPAVPPEKTEMRQIRMPGHACGVKMNTTSLVSVQDKMDEQGRLIEQLLVKKNFWDTEGNKN